MLVLINISAYIRSTASAFGYAARTSTSNGRYKPIDNGHVSGHVHEEREISKQAHFVRFRGRTTEYSYLYSAVYRHLYGVTRKYLKYEMSFKLASSPQYMGIAYTILRRRYY